ncbi:AB hydrolase-1 domain-containing protein [Psidium guajava]|nr:AB hydrolase-1 domain-containing protein [Psidium guajava]
MLMLTSLQLLVKPKTKKKGRKSKKATHRTQVSETHTPPLKLCLQLASKIDGRIIHHVPPPPPLPPPPPPPPPFHAQTPITAVSSP